LLSLLSFPTRRSSDLQVGYTGNVIVPGYNAFAGLVRPYSDGWIGYDIPWAYVDQANIGFDLQLHKRDVYFIVDAYIKHNKNQVLSIPSQAEYGYEYKIEPGMNVRNVGLDVAVGGNIIEGEPGDFRWNSGVNFGFNTNELTALPGGLDEVIIQNRKLKVGERID